MFRVAHVALRERQIAAIRGLRRLYAPTRDNVSCGRLAWVRPQMHPFDAHVRPATGRRHPVRLRSSGARLKRARR